jgi:hypothetical protein
VASMLFVILPTMNSPAQCSVRARARKANSYQSFSVNQIRFLSL